ncbi:MAG: phosphatidylglycerol lysyltransferase domain-containing protein, partial [Endomicrobiaceae bacterium]|nr:phosphatidylglycerol lysyltransferase domain-containing protein [Endomicrobiaceae bacterium]
TFLSGTIILFSGVTTVSSSIISRLVVYIPSIILDLLHFSISIVGILLLFISRGLLLRIRAAYVWAVALFATLFPLALINGYGYEKILALIVMLSLVIPSKKYFYRNLSLVTPKLNMMWFSAITAVFIGSVWIGFFVYKQDIYTITNFLTSLFSASDAGRFLRICTGMAVILLIVSLSELLKRSRYKQVQISSDNIKSLANSSKYVYANYAFENRNLFYKDMHSFIMYSQINNNSIVFGDPVGRDDSAKELIWDFKEMTDLKNTSPTFLYVGHKNLRIYDDMGMDIASFGSDANILLETFSEDIPSLADIKENTDKMDKNYQFEIIDFAAFQKEKKYVDFVDFQWQKDFGNLKNKMFDISAQFASSYILVKKDGFISAYAYLLLSQNKYEVFVSNVRYTSDCGENMLQYILFKTVCWAKGNNYKWFNLGLTPTEKIILDDDFVQKAKIFVFGEHFKYDMNALKNFKLKFRPTFKNKYIVFYADRHLSHFLKDFFYLYS